MDSMSNSDVGNYITSAEWNHVIQGVSVLIIRRSWYLPAVTRSHGVAFRLGHTVSLALSFHTGRCGDRGMVM